MLFGVQCYWMPCMVLSPQSDPYITSDKLIYQLVETVACNG